MQKKYTSAAVLITTLATMSLLVVPAFAETNPSSVPQNTHANASFGMARKGAMMGRPGMRPGAFGTVTAINGTTLTVSSTNPQTKTVTLYTVDASGATVMKNRATSSLSAIAVGDTVAVVGTINGTSITATILNDGKIGEMGMMPDRKPGITGTVASISGTTLTVTAKQFAPKAQGSIPPTVTTVTYTVNASGATIQKNGTTSSLSSIAVGDTVMIEGTVSGTTVTATAIRDGMGERESAENMGTLPAGNGLPVVGGTVTAVSGNTITIANKAGVTYTVDATSATFNKAGMPTGATISNVTVGDMLVIQGATTGTTVTASSVLDQGTAPALTSNGTPEKAQKQGFFAGVGNFFKHLFGY